MCHVCEQDQASGNNKPQFQLHLQPQRPTNLEAFHLAFSDNPTLQQAGP